MIRSLTFDTAVDDLVPTSSGAQPEKMGGAVIEIF